MTYLKKAIKSYNERQIKLLTIGEKNIVCVQCNALRYKDDPKGFCCLKGKVELPQREIPDELKLLLEDPEFLRSIRKYNQGMAWTSLTIIGRSRISAKY